MRRNGFRPQKFYISFGVILYLALIVWFIQYHLSTCRCNSSSEATIKPMLSLNSDSKQQSNTGTFTSNTAKGYRYSTKKCLLTLNENHYTTGYLPDINKIAPIMNEKYAKYFNQNISTKVWGAESVDMDNDYYPYVDFKFVAPEISPKVHVMGKYFMLVLVNTGAKGDVYRKHREAIRQTWGNYSNCEQTKALTNETLKSLNWLLVFVVGKAGPGTNDDELNMAEARKHNDMLIGNITDNYMNNIVKFYMGQLWASSFDANYILKTDDDVYVRIPRVLEYLVHAKFPKPFYGGAAYATDSPVIREPRDKWAISWKYHQEYTYPPFNPGAFYILSVDLAKRLLAYAFSRRPFHTDDAFVGVAMHDLGVKATKIPSFQRRKNVINFVRGQELSRLLRFHALGDSLEVPLIIELHDRFQSHFCPGNNAVTLLKHTVQQVTQI